jgi:nitrogen-specific signal transduction histidine kinase
MMSIQAAQFAAMCERLGRRMLAQLESLAEGLWDRAPLIHFFTTQEVGAGTGLGLSITYGSIKEHQGTISIENHPDEGTLFLIQLPLEP